MKIDSPRKIRIPIRIKLFKKDKLTLDTTFYKRSSVYQVIEPKSWDRAYLKVSYGNKHFNDGEYETLTDFKKALSAFTEIDLLKYFV